MVSNVGRIEPICTLVKSSQVLCHATEDEAFPSLLTFRHLIIRHTAISTVQQEACNTVATCAAIQHHRLHSYIQDWPRL